MCYLFNKSTFPITSMAEHDPQHDDDGHGLAVQTSKPKLKRPPMYKVLLLNDDFTPMDFVVHVLEAFFQIDRHRATRIMLTVHTEGKGVCGVFSREVAEMKVEQVNNYARQHEHPLLCVMEPE